MQHGRAWLFFPKRYIDAEYSAFAPDFHALAGGDAKRAERMSASFDRTIQLKSFAAAIAVSVFFSYPFAVANIDTLFRDTEDLPLEPVWLVALILVSIYFGAVWANATKADVQYRLAGLLQTYKETDTKAGPLRGPLAVAIAVMVPLSWFGAWTYLELR